MVAQVKVVLPVQLRRKGQKPRLPFLEDDPALQPRDESAGMPGELLTEVVKLDPGRDTFGLLLLDRFSAGHMGHHMAVMKFRDRHGGVPADFWFRTHLWLA